MSAAPRCSGAVLRRLAALVASVSVLRCAAVSLGTDPKHDKYGLRCLADSQVSLQSYVTAIVSTSPRAEDASGQGLEVLKETVCSIRKRAWPLPRDRGGDLGRLACDEHLERHAGSPRVDCEVLCTETPGLHGMERKGAWRRCGHLWERRRSW